MSGLARPRTMTKHFSRIAINGEYTRCYFIDLVDGQKWSLRSADCPEDGAAAVHKSNAEAGISAGENMG